MSEARKCSVQLLDDRKLDITLQPRLTAKELLDIVASHCTLKEKEYFGLYYEDGNYGRIWLRLEKRALEHDFPDTDPIPLYLGVKNFLPSITSLKETRTIELFYSQARKLIFTGEIECESDTVLLLAAYVLQATNGDYVSDAIALEDLKTLDVLPVKTLQEHPVLAYCEVKILAQYRLLDGINRGEAIVNYLSIVERLPMYGVHYYNVKDKNQIPWKIGFSYRGISQYDFKDKVTPRKTYSWSQMENLYYRNRKFSVEVRNKPKVTSLRLSFRQHVQVIAWYADTSQMCREIWVIAVGQHQFYLDKNLARSNNSGQRTLKDIAKDLSKSSSSISSMFSNFSGRDDLSDSASYYYSLDGASVTSSEIMGAEKDMYSALKARKAFLEQQLVEKRELLNEICLREAELTGQVPSEMPESPTHPGNPMRRKVGTSFEFSESILQGDGDADEREYDIMLRDYEIQNQITAAAHRLALDPNARRKIRKARQISYQKALVKLKTMEQQLEYCKKEAARNTSEAINKLRDDVDSSFDSDTCSIQSKANSDSGTFSVPGIHPKRLAQLTKKRSSSTPPIPAPLHTPRIEHAEANGYKYRSTLDVDVPFHRSSSFNNSPIRAQPVAVSRTLQSAHNSAEHLNQISYSNGPQDYVYGEFSDTGIYSNVTSKRYHFSSNSGIITHSLSSNGLSCPDNISPMTMRRLQMLNLSSSNPHLKFDSQSQSSLSTDVSDQSDQNSWTGIEDAEETLV